MCSVDDCFHLLMCGEVTDGGPCDQLDACCDEMPPAMAQSCHLGASGARQGGDEVCEMAMDALCP
jgi:hypothetical protein